MESARHVSWMRLALRLARRAQGQTSPNPAVGAVLVKGDRVIGRGYHRRAGRPHAEVEALRQAGASARGATLYVTLEPCDHYGRTPPCCDAILSAGIRHVVIATRDPHPRTNGRGIRRLRRAGLRVTTGVLEDDAQRLIEPFRKAVVRRLPWMVAKVGQSLDGKIATRTGESQWITSAASRALARRWRSRVDAVLVGINTVLQDDPLLSARGAGRRAARPVKVILDNRLRTPPGARCLSSRSPAPTIIATTSRVRTREAALIRQGAQVRRFPSANGRVPLRRLCRALVRYGIHSVLIEGGGEVLASAFEAQLVDHLLVFIAPRLIGGCEAPTSWGGQGVARLRQAVQLADARIRRVGPDLCVEGRVIYPRTGAR